MAMSKAYRGLRLPDFKRQRCGHYFNASGTSVRACRQCRAARGDAHLVPIVSDLVERVHFAVEFDRALMDERTMERITDGDVTFARALIAGNGHYDHDDGARIHFRGEHYSTAEILAAAREAVAAFDSIQIAA